MLNEVRLDSVGVGGVTAAVPSFAEVLEKAIRARVARGERNAEWHHCEDLLFPRRDIRINAPARLLLLWPQAEVRYRADVHNGRDPLRLALVVHRLCAAKVRRPQRRAAAARFTPRVSAREDALSGHGALLKLGDGATVNS
jgi:hypothetical protein